MAWVKIEFPLRIRDTAAAWSTQLDTDSSNRIDALSEALTGVGAVAVAVVPDQDGPPVLEPALGSTPLNFAAHLQAWFPLDLDVAAVRAVAARHQVTIDRTEFVADQDWSATWHDLREPREFGRLRLVPRDYQETGGQNHAATPVLRLDPGLAFGSGSHETTGLCLHWLASADLVGRTVLDFGCGSGILAIAAAKLGAARVIAVDYDPQAIVATHENAKVNDVALDVMDVAGFRNRFVDSDEPGHVGPIDVVVANILARTLIELAPTFTRVSGVVEIALSGILTDQTSAVVAAYPQFAFAPPAVQEEWVLLHGTRAQVSD